MTQTSAALTAPRRAPALILFLACLGLLVPGLLHAQNLTWIDANTNDWSLTAPNWNPGAVSWSDNANAIFSGTGETIEIASDITVGNITFSGTTSAYTIADANNDSIFSLTTGSVITVTTAGQTATISEIIAAGGFTKAGAGNLLLTGANTFSDAVSVTAGTLRIGHATALGTATSTTTVSGTGIIELQDGITVTGETLNLNGNGSSYGGLRTATNANATWAGGIILGTDGRLGANAGSVLTVTGLIQNGASNGLVISSSGNGLTAGIVRVSTPASYTGTTTIVRGVLQLGVANALPTGTILNVDFSSADEDATFDFAGFSQTLAGLTRGGTGSGLGGAFVINSGGTTSTLTLNVGGNQEYTGVIQGAINLVKNGASTQIFSGTTSYTGTTTINAGTLSLNGTSTLPGAIGVSGGILNLFNGTHSLGPITLTSGQFTANTGSTATIASFSGTGGTATLNGPLTITGATTTTTAGTYTFAGATTFGGSVSFANALAVTFGSANTIAAGTSFQISGSTILNVNNSGGFGSITALTVGNGARLTLGNGVVITGKTASINGNGGTNSGGAIQSADNATATWAGNIILTGNARLSGGSSGILNINGVISGNFGVLYSRLTNSTTVVNAVSTYTGDTQMYAAASSTTRLIIGVDNALSTSRLSFISTAALGNMIIDLNGRTSGFTGMESFTNATDGQAPGALMTILNNGGTAATLTVSSNLGAEQIFNGRINNGTGVLSLFKSGSVTQTLLAPNGYTGTTTVAGGILQIGKASATGYTGSTATLASTSYILTGGPAFAAATTGTLVLDNVGASNNNTNRLPDSSAISFRGGALTFRGSELAATNSSEAIASIDLVERRSILTMTYGGTNTATLTIGSLLTRPTNGGILLVNGSNLGANGAATASISRVFINGGVTLVGTTAPLSTGVNSGVRNTQVVPAMLGEFAGASTNANTFLTYEATTGLRPLDPLNEFTQDAFTTGNNTRITTSTNLGAGTTSINSLIITGATTSANVTNGSTLNIASGNVLIINAGGTLGNQGNGGILTFDREATITLQEAGNTFIYARITGTQAVSYYGAGTLVTNQQHTYTGNTGLYGAAAIPQAGSIVNGSGVLISGPFGTGTVIFGGSGIRASTIADLTVHNNIDLRSDTTFLTSTNASSDKALYLTGNISLTNGTRTLTQASAANTYLNGIISDGPSAPGSGITLATSNFGNTTAVVLSGNNTYTGATTVNGSTLIINGDQSAATGAVNVNSGGTLGGIGTLGGATTIASGATLSPGNVATGSASLVGTLSSVSSLTLKSGSNTALQITTASYTSLDGFGYNEPGTPGYNDYILAHGNPSGSAGAAHDKLIFTGITQETGGKITVSGVGLVPAAGLIFNLLDWTDLSTFSTNLGPTTRTGAEDALFDLDLPDISASGYAWDTSFFATHGIIVITPEPARALLLGIGLAMLGLRRRRK